MVFKQAIMHLSVIQAIIYSRLNFDKASVTACRGEFDNTVSIIARNNPNKTSSNYRVFVYPWWKGNNVCHTRVQSFCQESLSLVRKLWQDLKLLTTGNLSRMR